MNNKPNKLDRELVSDLTFGARIWIGFCLILLSIIVYGDIYPNSTIGVAMAYRAPTGVICK